MEEYENWEEERFKQEAISRGIPGYDVLSREDLIAHFKINDAREKTTSLLMTTALGFIVATGFMLVLLSLKPQMVSDEDTWIGGMSIFFVINAIALVASAFYQSQIIELTKPYKNQAKSNQAET